MKMYRLIPLTVIAFIALGAFLTSCESEILPKPCDTCDVPCDTCLPCDTCDTTLPCDTCDTTDPNPNDTTSHDFSWTEYSIPEEVNLTGCAVFNENLIYVMGNKLWKWNGINWVREKVIIRGTQREGGFADDSYFALSSSDMWMVGGIAYHYNNGIADEYRGDAVYKGARACWGTSSNDMFLVGDSGRIYHFDGETFTKFPQVTTKNLRDVWGTSHNDVWTCGFNSSTGESVLLHYDGSSWQEVDLSSVGWIGIGKHALQSVWATDSNGHKLVAASGSLVWKRTDNNVWRNDSGYVPNGLGGGAFIGLGIRGDHANNVLVAGGWGFVAHWNGKTWKKYNELYNYSKPTYGASSLSIKGNTAAVVGSKDGQSWIAIGRRKP